MIRYAIVRNARTRSEAEAYLPDNYRVIHETTTPPELLLPTEERPSGWKPPLPPRAYFVIEGEDKAGWTLNDYVIPRYASGLIYATEIDLSHPIMKEIPA